MTVCPHCYTDSATLRAQAEMLEARDQEIADLKRMLLASEGPVRMNGLTPMEARLLNALLAHEKVSHEAALQVMATKSDEDKIVSVIICKLRKKLKPLGLEIRTIWGEGYYIPREMAKIMEKSEAA